MPESAPIDALVIIYQADGGRWNALLDSAHKLLSPSTYACDLCALTHGLAGAHSAWRDFEARCPVPIEIHHRDDGLARFPHLTRADLPTILRRRGVEVEVALGPDDFTALDLTSLIAHFDALLPQ